MTITRELSISEIRKLKEAAEKQASQALHGILEQLYEETGLSISDVDVRMTHMRSLTNARPQVVGLSVDIAFERV